MSEEKEITIEHPMEEILDIEPGTTIATVVERNTELVVADEFDAKDQEIEGQMQEVYEAAMEAFEDQCNDNQVIEPKYRARNQEVAVQFLNAALNAAKEKSTLKQHKDKLAVAQARAVGPKTLNQNLIVADRNDILKHIMNGDQKDEE